MSLTWLLLARLFGCHYAFFQILLALAPVIASVNSTRSESEYDHRLSRSRLANYEVARQSPAVLAELFCALDSDQDGLLTKEEAARGVARALGKEAQHQVGKFNVQNLANMVWAFAATGQSDGQLFATLAKAAERRLGHFSAQGLANMVWAFSTASQLDSQLFLA